jgi:ABC-2 type transport system ATP-binding protein
VLFRSPTTGLDPRSRLGLWDVIREQAKSCNTVFLTTQYLEEADRLANKIAIMDSGKLIREGTPQELKDCCGGDTHVKVRLAEPGRTGEAVKVLRPLGGDKTHGIPETGEISLPAVGGASMLANVVRALDGAGIAVAELGLKQPTLDDVFLALTGRTAEETSGVDDRQAADSTGKGKAI